MAALLFGTSLVLGSCDDDTNPVGPGLGAFTATISGEIVATLAGPAFFGVEDDGTGADVFSLALLTSDTRYRLILGRSDGRLPGGRHTVGDGSNPAVLFGDLFVDQNLDDVVDRTFLTTGGTVTITMSNNGELTGTLNDVTAGDVETGRTITVSGSFSARCAPGVRCA